MHTATPCTPLSAHHSPLMNSPQPSPNSQPQPLQALIKLPNPPPTISITFSSSIFIYLKPFLVNSHLPIYLETINNHPHPQTRKTSDSSSSYRPISLISCTFKLFKRMVLRRLIYFLEQQGTLSPVRAGFRPGRSTVDQVFLSQSIADSFHQSKPGARTVLATVDFAKAFDSVWHSALLSKLLSLDLPLCFVEWIRSYLSDRCSKVRICSSYSRPFRLRRGVSQGSVLGPVLFLYIKDLPTFLPTSVKTSVYADDLAIWASSPSVECATSTSCPQ